MEGPENSFDRLAYLRARVLDLWVDNYDRHRGQWRWMRLPGKAEWQPLPEDPDFVLIHRDGQVARSVRSQVPQYLKFSEKFPGRIDGALLNSAEMDRWILAGATAADFESIAHDLQSRFTDQVIDGALRQMPAEWYAIRGAELAAALRSRREVLVDYLLRVYRYYAQVVDIHATDRSEQVAIVRHADGAVEVTVALADRADAPYYRRRFLATETDEVRVYLHGGDDRVDRSGPAGGPITVRVIAGGGQDTVDDSKSGGTDIWRDAGTLNVTRGPGTDVRNDVWPNPVPVKDAPWIEPRSYGHWTVPTPVFGYAPDVYLYLGYGFTRTSWGFRTEPAKRVQTLRGAITTGDTRGKLEYLGTFRRPASGFGYQLGAYASGVEAFNYFGYGNDSDEIADRARYKTRENVFQVTPVIRYEAGLRTEAFIGPEVRYSQTPTDSGTLVAEEAPAGVGDYGRVAIRAGVAFDSRQRSVVAAKADYTDTSLRSGDDSSVTGVRIQALGLLRAEGVGRDLAVRRRRRRRLGLRRQHARAPRDAGGRSGAHRRLRVVRCRRNRRQQQPRLPQPPVHRRLVAVQQRVASRVAGHDRQVVHRGAGRSRGVRRHRACVAGGRGLVDVASVARRRAAAATRGGAAAAARHCRQRQGRHAAPDRIRLPVLSQVGFMG